ncbi:hypothetical protein [Bacillus sp. AK128]
MVGKMIRDYTIIAPYTSNEIDMMLKRDYEELYACSNFNKINSDLVIPMM